MLDPVSEVREPTHFGMSVLHEAEAPIWAKFHMPWDHEGQGDLVMQASHHMPDEVMNHGGVLILATTIISMQVCFFLAHGVRSNGVAC